MREICTSGSGGGRAGNRSVYPTPTPPAFLIPGVGHRRAVPNPRGWLATTSKHSSQDALVQTCHRPVTRVFSFRNAVSAAARLKL